ncbi:hypothetical protein AMECASPLE_015060 [Ameca splendens]|uniref:Uncharacterized protein n=1 Tax=Ameca splendens TaxID=208324 RepID=A0ABV0Y1V0_9TELE
MGDFKCGALKGHWLSIIADLKLIGWSGDTRRSHWVKLEKVHRKIAPFMKHCKSGDYAAFLSSLCVLAKDR